MDNEIHHFFRITHHGYLTYLDVEPSDASDEIRLSDTRCSQSKVEAELASQPTIDPIIKIPHLQFEYRRSRQALFVIPSGVSQLSCVAEVIQSL